MAPADLFEGLRRRLQEDLVRPDAALVFATDVFGGLPPGRPSAADLVQWGLVEEFVDRLGPILRLKPLGAGGLEEVLWRQMRDLGATYRALGYRLVVRRATFESVADLVASKDCGIDPWSGATLVRDAGERELTRLLARDALLGSTLELSVDDLQRPVTGPSARRIGFQ